MGVVVRCRCRRWVGVLAAIGMLPAVGFGDPVLPVIPAGTFTVAAATGNATTDTADLKAALAAAKTAGGGTVVVPAGTYLSNALTLSSSIDLQLSAGAVIQNNAPASTFITTSGSTHDVEITGSGILDGHATAVSGNNMVTLQNVSRLLISGVTIENASHEHLVIEGDSNVTVSGININDNYTVSQVKGYLANTDAIDYSGSNFLIQGSTINAGDDDIVAKPQNTLTSNITIQNDTIGAGHGISIGGQTNSGLNGLVVNNVTFSGTDNGLRLKAGTGQGGVVKNVSFSNITMTGVGFPIIINSWYQDGDDYGSKQVSGSALHNVTNPGETLVAVNQQANTNLDPFFDNISYSNITVTGATQNVAIIYGLDSAAASANDPPRNIDTISFSNVSLSGAFGADIYYASNLDLSGLKVTATTHGAAAMNLFGDTPLGDANGDGKVDVNDLDIVLANLGMTTSARSLGNFDGAATVDLTDLNDVLNHLGTGFVNGGLTASGVVEGAAAPEPGTVGVLGVGILLVGWRRVKGRGRAVGRD
jgi:polygalacturonase